MLVLKGLVGLHRTVQLQLLQHYWPGHRLDYCAIEWFALEMNRDHSITFETASKYCILEKEMATHSGTLAWKIPWMEDPGRPQSMGLQTVRHNQATSLSLRFGLFC